MKHYETKEKCDVCGNWVNVYKCFFDEKGRACCICEKCYEEMKQIKQDNPDQHIVQTKIF